MPDVERNSDDGEGQTLSLRRSGFLRFPYGTVLGGADGRPTVRLGHSEVAASNFLKLAFRFYNKDEYLEVKEKGEAEFFRIWARREALRKAEGESVFSEAPSVLWNRVVSENQFWEIRDITMPFDLAAAVCIGVRKKRLRKK
mgnify:CR=1 FL=1